MKLKLFISIFLLSSFLFSCKEIQDRKTGKRNFSGLGGEWVLKYKREGEVPGQIFSWKFVPENRQSGNYEFYWKADYPVKGKFVVITGEKGTYRIKDDILFPVTKNFGSQQAEPMSDIFYDSVKWYSPGDPQFELFQATDSIGFNLKGDVLLLKIDNNGDGDWEDDDEITEFSRQIN